MAIIRSVLYLPFDITTLIDGHVLTPGEEYCKFIYARSNNIQGYIIENLDTEMMEYCKFAFGDIHFELTPANVDRIFEDKQKSLCLCLIRLKFHLS